MCIGLGLGVDSVNQVLFQVQQGGEIPQEYYLKGTGQYAGEKLTKATVSRGGTLQLPHDVTTSGSVIK